MLKAMNSPEITKDFLVNDPNWAIDFAPKGTRLGLGDTLTRKRYANFLERLAAEGPVVFYRGEVAREIVEALNKTGGIMTVEDLEGYRVAVDYEPPSITYRDWEVTGNGAPASGIVVLNILKITEGFEDIGDEVAVNMSTHRLDEALKFGFGWVCLIFHSLMLLLLTCY